MKKTLTLSTLSALILSASALTYSPPAQACSGDTQGAGRVMGYAYNTGGNMAAQSTLNCFYNESMSWLEKLYTYLTTGAVNGGTDGGKGIHGFLETIAGQQRQDRTLAEEQMANQVQHEQRIAVEAAMAQKIINNLPDPRDCMDAPARMAGRAVGGGGASVRAIKGKIETKIMAESAKRSDLEHVATVYTQHKEGGYCSPVDRIGPDGKPREAFGCTASDIGKMPDGNARVQSLFTPAHDFTDPDAAAATSLTYNNGKVDANGKPVPIEAKFDQYQAATDTIANLASRFQPPVLDPRVEKIPQGRIYLTRLKTYQARVSAAVNVLTNIAAQRTPGTGTLSADQTKTIWQGMENRDLGVSKTEDTYARLFPGVTFPEIPSEAELMRFEVMRRYADRDPEFSWDAGLMRKKENAQLEIARTLALTNFLLYQIHNRVEEGNSVAAVSLLQDINPIVKADLERATFRAASAKGNAREGGAAAAPTTP